MDFLSNLIGTIQEVMIMEPIDHRKLKSHRVGAGFLILAVCQTWGIVARPVGKRG